MFSDQERTEENLERMRRTPVRRDDWFENCCAGEALSAVEWQRRQNSDGNDNGMHVLNARWRRKSWAYG
jgi:hypothetical protein